MATKQAVITVPEGKLCDYIDQKLRNDTPEEYVRQNVEKRLVNEHKYSREQIEVEKIISFGSKRPRVDLAVFPEDAPSHDQEHTYIVIECKKEKISPKDKKHGVGQLQSYMSACANCEWGLWTNGKFKAVYRKVINEQGKVELREYNDIPSKGKSIEDIDRPKRQDLKEAVDHNLLFTFKTCHNHIYAIDGMQKQPAFFEFLKVIFCKIEDERNIPHPLEFYATSGERSNPDGQLTVKNRISKIFDRVKKKHSSIFSKNEQIKLQSRSLSYIVSEIQKYSLLTTHIDIKGKAYEMIVGSNLRGDRGEFFTPRNVTKMVVDMISPDINDKVLDPACGTGGFLVRAMNSIIAKLKLYMIEESGKDEKEWTKNETNIVKERADEISMENFFGFDINPDLVRATKMNMVMNNDGSGNIIRLHSLLPPHEWDSACIEMLINKLNLSKTSFKNHRSIDFFDVLITNPPFGSKIPIQDSVILEQYDLGYKWKKEGGEWVKTGELQSSVPPEQLFIERCLQFLKPGGRMAIVLPDSILGSPGLEYIREWLIRKTYVVASIDLHVDTFQPHNGTQTSVLFLQKKSEDEINREKTTGIIPDYNIFMAMVEKVGHDKRGNPIFKRDKYGEEILVPEDTEIFELDVQADGTRSIKTQAKKKVRDDQTPLVAEVFEEWKREEGFTW